jgi:hypothetical protein
VLTILSSSFHVSMLLARSRLFRFSKSVLFNTSIGAGNPKMYAEVSNSGLSILRFTSFPWALQPTRWNTCFARFSPTVVISLMVSPSFVAMADQNFHLGASDADPGRGRRPSHRPRTIPRTVEEIYGFGLPRVSCAQTWTTVVISMASMCSVTGASSPGLLAETTKYPYGTFVLDGGTASLSPGWQLP